AGRPARGGPGAISRRSVASQCLRYPLRGSRRGHRPALGQFPADLFDGRHHQHGHAPVGKLGGCLVPRLVIVSNRFTVPEPNHPPPPGGLAVAVHAALKDRPGVWFGWSGKVDDSPNIQPTTVHRDQITYVVTDLQTADYQEYYNGFANRVLWPILHYRVDLAEFSRSDLTGYLRVNGLFADQLAKLLLPDDVI